MEKCIDIENLKWAVFHGLSDNRFKRLDISDARELVGYAPQDDATRELPQVKDLNLAENVNAHPIADREDKSKASGLREDL